MAVHRASEMRGVRERLLYHEEMFTRFHGRPPSPAERDRLLTTARREVMRTIPRPPRRRPVHVDPVAQALRDEAASHPDPLYGEALNRALDAAAQAPTTPFPMPKMDETGRDVDGLGILVTILYVVTTFFAVSSVVWTALGNESGTVSSFVALMVVLSFANFAKLMRSHQEHERR